MKCMPRRPSREPVLPGNFTGKKDAGLGDSTKICLDILNVQRQIFQNIYSYTLGILLLHAQKWAAKWQIFKNFRKNYKLFHSSSRHQQLVIAIQNQKILFIGVNETFPLTLTPFLFILNCLTSLFLYFRSKIEQIKHTAGTLQKSKHQYSTALSKKHVYT